MKQAACKVLILVLVLGANIHAQELITDRPDFTESAFVIPARMIQIESGAVYADFSSWTELSYPNALARIGLGHNLELRFGFSGWTGVTVNAKSTTYINDLLLEAKYQLTGGAAAVPLAVLLVSTLPTGDDEISAGQPEYGIKLAAEFDLDDHMALGTNLGFISADDGADRKILSLVSASLGIGISNRLAGFIEVLAEMPQNEAWQPALDGGFTFLLTPVAQLDLYLGKGLNDHAPNLIIGGGFSFRFGT